MAVAAQQAGGVYLSVEGGRSETFRPMGLQGEDVRARVLHAEPLDDAAVRRGDAAVIAVLLDSPGIWADMEKLLTVAFNRLG